MYTQEKCRKKLLAQRDGLELQLKYYLQLETKERKVCRVSSREANYGKLPGKNMINKAKVCNADLSHCLFHDLPPMKGLKCCLPGFTFVLPGKEGRRNIFVNVCLDFRQIGEVRELYLCLLRLNSLWLKIILMLKWYI